MHSRNFGVTAIIIGISVAVSVYIKYSVKCRQSLQKVTDKGKKDADIKECRGTEVRNSVDKSCSPAKEISFLEELLLSPTSHYYLTLGTEKLFLCTHKGHPITSFWGKFEQRLAWIDPYLGLRFFYSPADLCLLYERHNCGEVALGFAVSRAVSPSGIQHGDKSNYITLKTPFNRLSTDEKPVEFSSFVLLEIIIKRVVVPVDFEEISQIETTDTPVLRFCASESQNGNERKRCGVCSVACEWAPDVIKLAHVEAQAAVISENAKVLKRDSLKIKEDGGVKSSFMEVPVLEQAYLDSRGQKRYVIRMFRAHNGLLVEYRFNSSVPTSKAYPSCMLLLIRSTAFLSQPQETLSTMYVGGQRVCIPRFFKVSYNDPPLIPTCSYLFQVEPRSGIAFKTPMGFEAIPLRTKRKSLCSGELDSLYDQLFNFFSESKKISLPMHTKRRENSVTSSEYRFSDQVSCSEDERTPLVSLRAQWTMLHAQNNIFLVENNKVMLQLYHYCGRDISDSIQTTLERLSSDLLQDKSKICFLFDGEPRDSCPQNVNVLFLKHFTPTCSTRTEGLECRFGLFQDTRLGSAYGFSSSEWELTVDKGLMEKELERKNIAQAKGLPGAASSGLAEELNKLGIRNSRLFSGYVDLEINAFDTKDTNDFLSTDDQGLIMKPVSITLCLYVLEIGIQCTIIAVIAKRTKTFSTNDAVQLGNFCASSLSYGNFIGQKRALYYCRLRQGSANVFSLELPMGVSVSETKIDDFVAILSVNREIIYSRPSLPSYSNFCNNNFLITVKEVPCPKSLTDVHSSLHVKYFEEYVLRCIHWISLLGNSFLTFDGELVEHFVSDCEYGSLSRVNITEVKRLSDRARSASVMLQERLSTIISFYFVYEHETGSLYAAPNQDDSDATILKPSNIPCIKTSDYFKAKELAVIGYTNSTNPFMWLVDDPNLSKTYREESVTQCRRRSSLSSLKTERSPSFDNQITFIQRMSFVVCVNGIAYIIQGSSNKANFRTLKEIIMKIGLTLMV